MFEFGLGWKIRKYGTSTASVIYCCVGNYLKQESFFSLVGK